MNWAAVKGYLAESSFVKEYAARRKVVKIDLGKGILKTPIIPTEFIKWCTQKESTKKTTKATGGAAVEAESTNAQYLKIGFGYADDEVWPHDARECLDPKQTCFVVFDEATPRAYIQIGDEVSVLGEDQLETDEELEGCFEVCAKHLESSGRTEHHNEAWLFGFMTSCWDGDADGLVSYLKKEVAAPDEVLASVEIQEDNYVIESFTKPGLYDAHDGMAFCLIESCSLEVTMAGDKVVFDGTNYEIKDLFNLMDDFRVCSSQVTEFKSEHDYRCDFCVFGEIDPARPWIGRVLS